MKANSDKYHFLANGKDKEIIRVRKTEIAKK